MNESIRRIRSAALAVVASYLAISGIIVFLPQLLAAMGLTQQVAYIALMSLAIATTTAAAAAFALGGYNKDSGRTNKALLFVLLAAVFSAASYLLLFALFSNVRDARMTLVIALLLVLFLLCLAAIVVWVYRLAAAAKLFQGAGSPAQLLTLFAWVLLFAMSPLVLTLIFEFAQGGNLEGTSTFGFLPLFFSPIAIAAVPVAYFLALLLPTKPAPAPAPAIDAGTSAETDVEAAEIAKPAGDAESAAVIEDDKDSPKDSPKGAEEDASAKPEPAQAETAHDAEGESEKGA